MSLKIFNLYHKPAHILKSDTLIPIQAGRAISPFKLNMQWDDTDDNISHKNASYAELTGMYWVWKNIKEDYIGFCHYRRYFNYANLDPNITLDVLDSVSSKITENIESVVEKFDIVVPSPMKFDYSIQQQYEINHRKSDWLTMMEIIKSRYPSYANRLDYVIQNQNYMYPYNMFIAKYDVFDTYMKFLFDLLLEFESKIVIPEDNYQRRVFAFMAERMLTIFLDMCNQTTRKLKVACLKTLFINEKTPSNTKLAYQNNKIEVIQNKKRSTSIILLNWNSLDLLKNCLSLIEKNTELPYTIIIVDNGSTDGSYEFLAQSKYKTVLLEKNYGFSKGMNFGIRESDPNDNIVLMNVDAEPQPNWLDELYKTYDSFDNVGLIGPLGNNVPSKYQALDSVKQDSQVFILIFYCVFISRKCINTIGVLDERYGLGGYEDNDYSYRSILAGMNNFISAKSTVLHEPHQVTKLNGLDENMYTQNKDVFHEKFHSILTKIALNQNIFTGSFAKNTGLVI